MFGWSSTLSSAFHLLLYLADRTVLLIVLYISSVIFLLIRALYSLTVCRKAALVPNEEVRPRMEELLSQLRLHPTSTTSAPGSSSEDDVIEYYSCAHHGFVTSSKLEYLRHIARMDVDFLTLKQPEIKQVAFKNAR